MRYSFDGREYVGPILDVIHIPAQIESSALVVQGAPRAGVSLFSFVFVNVKQASKLSATVESIAVAIPLADVRFCCMGRCLNGVVEYPPLPVLDQ